MRNYYDFNGWGRDDRSTSPRWEPGEKPGPYGDVPGGEAAPETGVETPRRTPAAWKKSAKPKSAPRGLPGFILFLTLLLILTGLGMYLRGDVLGETVSFGDLWERIAPRNYWGDLFPRQGGDDDYYDYDYDEDDWISDLPRTTAERAPLEEGVALGLTPAKGAPLTPQEIYERVNPAVVQVRSYLRNGYALGTGVVMTGDGYIVTNAHVIAGARQIDVVLHTGQRARALLLGYDAGTDLAILKIEAEGLPVAEFGNSLALKVGDPAYAIGNPLGSELRGTMTDGIISAIDRSVSTDGGDMTLLQTTAALNSGNSGGALINQYGQVIGITNMKMMSDYETIEGLGFAIPTSVVKPVADQLISTGVYTGRPMLGITVATVEAGAIAEGSPAGVYIDSVNPGSDAWAKGLRQGDVIVAVDGTPVETYEKLQELKTYAGLGESIRLEVWSPGIGETRTVDVALVGSNALG